MNEPERDWEVQLREVRRADALARRELIDRFLPPTDAEVEMELARRRQVTETA